MDVIPPTAEQQAAYAACFAKSGRIQVGDYYENCDYLPCIALRVDPESDSVDGISLAAMMVPDGNTYGIGSCSLRHCAPRKILRAKIGDYLKLVHYQRHVITNRALYEGDENYMAWFGDRMQRNADMVAWGDKIANYLD